MTTSSPGQDSASDDPPVSHPADPDLDPVADEDVVPAPERDDRRAGTHNPWKYIGLTALGVVAALLLGWFAGILAGKAFDSDDPAASSAADPAPAGSSGAPTSGAPAAAEPIAIAGATLFDPPPGDGEENPDRIDLSYDGQPGTTWPTLQYKSVATFGNIKPGVGIIYDLGSEQPISRVDVVTSIPGSTVEVRTGTGTSGKIEDFPVVAGPVELAGTTEIPVAAGTSTRYVLVWITRLVQQQGFFQASLSEVAVITG